MDSTTLYAISPIDGRYQKQTADLREVFSEYGLIYYRVLVEVRWLQALAQTPAITEIKPLSSSADKFLAGIIDNFNGDDAKRIKGIEANTNHDIKAVEYYLKERLLENEELAPLTEFIHFACTSEDINNLAYALMLQTGRKTILFPMIEQLSDHLAKLAHQYADAPMLAHTHGQAATPTTMGKEIANFTVRLRRQLALLQDHVPAGKINGAVGNFNAHIASYPDVDWLEVSKNMVESLGLEWNEYTTQVEPKDTIAELLHIIMRVNTILVDFARDCWTYISLGYFKQKIVKSEVGSSTMPHKVNPIDFENAEGNLLMANNILGFLSQELPISRLQRDLTDSTKIRNIGVAFSHSVIAYQRLQTGVAKLELDTDHLAADLDEHWELLAEAIQTVMRRYGCETPYEQLKALTRGQRVEPQAMRDFIQSLELPEEARQALSQLTPHNYLGLAVELAKQV